MGGEIKLSEDQLNKIGAAAGKYMSEHAPCKVFNAEEVSWVKSCHATLKTTKGVALTTVVGSVVLIVFGSLIIGIAVGIHQKIAEVFPGVSNFVK